MKTLEELSPPEVEALPIDALAATVLEHCARTKEWNSHNLLGNARAWGLREPTLSYISEAVNWLVSHGLLARDQPGQSSAQSIFVTRAGSKAIAEGMASTIAGARLSIGLHPRLERVRTQFLIGEYELAAFAAMREVEIRVRELAGADPSAIGVKLMRSAFNPADGPLADQTLEPGERVGIMELFAGAIGTFKNPPSHRQVDYDDPTEASEVVMLADLLMRLLDRT